MSFKIQLKRKREIYGCLGKLNIYIDGEHVGKLGFKPLELNLNEGNHILEISIDDHKSSIEIDSNELGSNEFKVFFNPFLDLTYIYTVLSLILLIGLKLFKFPYFLFLLPPFIYFLYTSINRKKQLIFITKMK
jgi:hypothetical protein